MSDELSRCFHSSLITHYSSLFSHSPLHCRPCFPFWFLGLERIGVGDDRPVLVEIKIGAVVAVVANQTARIFRRRFVIAGGRRGNMVGAGTVTGFAMHVCELRRGLDVDEATILKSQGMTTDAGGVEDSLFRFERGERMRMAR